MAELDGVGVGPRRVTAKARDGAVASATVEVGHGLLSVVQLDLHEASSAGDLSTALLWSGIGVAAAGLGTAIVGGVQASGRVEQRCFVRAGDEGASCETVGQPTTGFDDKRLPNTDPDLVDSGGLSVLGLGIGLAVTGAAWSAGAAVFDEDVAMIITIAAGLVLGGAAYGVAAVAGGG